MNIRKATKNDFDELVNFYDYMCSVLAKKDFMPDGNKGGFPSRDMLSEAIAQGEQFVGVEDGKIIAAYMLNHDCDEAYLTANWKVEAAKDETVILHALRVLPEYSGKGYGKMLVRHAIETARKRNQKAIHLDVLIGNKIPEKIFTGLGFECVDTVEMCYADIGVTRKFYLMELAL